MNATASEPSYADFDDYRHNQRVVVILRWYLLIGWGVINHWAAPLNQSLLYVDLIALVIIVLNARLHLRLKRGEPVGRVTAIVMSLFDVAAITAGIAITHRFTNYFFILYYPALVCLAVVRASRD